MAEHVAGGVGAVVEPRHQGAAPAVAGDRGGRLLAGHGAQGASVGRPQRVGRPVRPQVVGVDVGLVARAMVVPDHHRPAGTVRDRDRRVLLAGRQAQRPAVRGPGGVHGPVRPHALGVDVGVEAAARVEPGDHGAAGTVGDDRRPRLVAGRGAERASVGRPGGVHRAGGQHALDVDVGVSAAAQVGPGDQRAAGAVRGDRRRRLVVRRRAHRAPVRGPRRVQPPGGEHALGVDVGVRPAAVVPPRHDRAAGAVRHRDRVDLVGGGGAQRAPVRRPGGVQRTVGQHALGVDVRRGAAVVVPDHDRPARAVRDRDRRVLSARGQAQRPSAGRPAGVHHARGEHALGVDVGVAVPVVVPGDDGAAGPVGHDRRRELIAGRGAHRDAPGRPQEGRGGGRRERQRERHGQGERDATTHDGPPERVRRPPVYHRPPPRGPAPVPAHPVRDQRR